MAVLDFLGMGGGKFQVEAPQPSQQELDIYDEIFTMLQDQQAYSEAMMPIYLQEAGYKEVRTPYEATAEETEVLERRESLLTEKENLESKIGGASPMGKRIYGAQIDLVDKKIAELDREYDIPKLQEKLDEGVLSYESITYEEMTPTQQKEYDVYQTQLDRYQKALAGEIPLTQQMIDQKQQEFEQLKSSIGTITGDDPETATATDTIGIQNLNEFKKRWGLVEEAQRYGEIGTAGQAVLGTAGLTTDLSAKRIGTLGAIGGSQAGTMQGYAGLLQPYQAYTQAGYQAQAQNVATRAQMLGSLLGIGGMLGGAGIIASSKDYKKNIKSKSRKDEDKALEDIKKTKSYNYRYKKYMGLGDEEHLGTITEESPEAYVRGKMIDLGDKVEYIGMGLKSLARKVDKIKGVA